jgi:hypothetical protein
MSSLGIATRSNKTDSIVNSHLLTLEAVLAELNIGVERRVQSDDIDLLRVEVQYGVFISQRLVNLTEWLRQERRMENVLGLDLGYSFRWSSKSGPFSEQLDEFLNDLLFHIWSGGEIREPGYEEIEKRLGVVGEAISEINLDVTSLKAEFDPDFVRLGIVTGLLLGVERSLRRDPQVSLSGNPEIVKSYAAERIPLVIRNAFKDDSLVVNSITKSFDKIIGSRDKYNSFAEDIASEMKDPNAKEKAIIAIKRSREKPESRSLLPT